MAPDGDFVIRFYLKMIYFLINFGRLPRRFAPRNDVRRDGPRNDVRGNALRNDVRDNAPRNDVRGNALRNDVRSDDPRNDVRGDGPGNDGRLVAFRTELAYGLTGLPELAFAHLLEFGVEFRTVIRLAVRVD